MTKIMVQAAAITAGVLVAALCFAPSAAQSGSAPAATCLALETTDLSGIQDAATQLMDASIVDAAADVPAHCHVQGYIWPQVGFELQLPISAWNGKFIQIGCGGYCGTTRTNGTLMGGWCEDALRRGYACIVSDQGHSTSKEGGGNARADALWANNNLQGEIDYGFRAAHVATLSGKAITQKYYGAAPKFSYFFGCSGGGRQALVEAQRFPWDFDGIVALDPSINLTTTGVQYLWYALVTRDKNGQPLFTSADIDVLHNAVLARCDLDDGVKDGVISYPPACQFDPSELICREGHTANCLSQAQVEAARKIYSGPVTSMGEELSYPPMPGSEKGVFSKDPSYKVSYWRYMGFLPDPGPNWTAADFDFDADYKRFGMMEMLHAADNPDLRKFKAAGGKLIIAQGWDDGGSPFPLQTIDYYQTVERAMGGRASTQDFARLFMIPGREHCGRGPGPHAVDFLSYLEAWVEQNRAPEMMIGAHVVLGEDMQKRVEKLDYGVYVRTPKDPTKVKFTRPLYPYPIQTRYKGEGDPNNYRNFEPVER